MRRNAISGYFRFASGKNARADLQPSGSRGCVTTLKDEENFEDLGDLQREVVHMWACVR
jgi:hypothetical protein